MAKLDFIPDAVEPLDRANAGDYRLLARRIKDGSASQQERDLAADLIRKLPKPVANRPAQYDTFMRNLKIWEFIEECLVASDPKGRPVKKYLVLEAAEEKFGLSKRTIREIYDNMCAARDGREPRQWPPRRLIK